MSCEINDNSCDICEERYCPDMLAAVHDEFFNKRMQIEGDVKRISEVTRHLKELEDNLQTKKEYMKTFKTTHEDAIELNETLYGVNFNV